MGHKEETRWKNMSTRVSQKGIACVQMQEDNERPLNCIGKGPSGIQKDVLEINYWELLLPLLKECCHTLQLQGPRYNGCWGPLKHSFWCSGAKMCNLSSLWFTHSSRFTPSPVGNNDSKPRFQCKRQEGRKAEGGFIFIHHPGFWFQVSPNHLTLRAWTRDFNDWRYKCWSIYICGPSYLGDWCRVAWIQEFKNNMGSVLGFPSQNKPQWSTTVLVEFSCSSPSGYLRHL